MSDPFIAEVKIFAGNFAPRGYLFCDGQLLPIAQNTALFSLIGTTYGGDGRNTTALPNLQDRAPMHPGRGPGLTSRRLGEKTGVTDVTLTTQEIPSHTHGTMGTTTAVAATGAKGNVAALSAGRGAAPLYAPTSVTNKPGMAADALRNTGGGQSHPNMQPYLTLNFIIAVSVGTYPSRS